MTSERLGALRQIVKDAHRTWPLSLGNILDGYDFADLAALLAVYDVTKRALMPNEDADEGLSEWQDEQGGCNFFCASTGRLGHEQHAPDCPLVLARAAIERVNEL